MNKKRLFAVIASVIMAATALPLTVSADWKTTNNQTYYLDESGDKVTGWQTIDGKKYYFSSKGVMKTGWLTMKSGKKYYFKKDGVMATGWVKIGDNKYYFSKKGIMTTGKAKIGKKIYSFNDDGVLEYQCKNTFVYVGDKLYSLDKNGDFCTGVEAVEFADGSSNLFYFGKNGYAVTTTKVIDGMTCEFDAKKGLVDAYVNIKVGKFDSDILSLSNFKVKNVSASYTKNKVSLTGKIKNNYSKAVTFYIYISYYDKDGNLIDNRQSITCNKLAPGETYKFEDSIYIDDVAYKIEFTDIKIFKA